MNILDNIKNGLLTFVGYLEAIGCDRFLILYNDTFIYISIFIALFIFTFLGSKIFGKQINLSNNFRPHFFIIGVASTLNTIIAHFLNVLFNSKYYWKDIIDNYFLIQLLLLILTLAVFIAYTCKNVKFLKILIGASFTWFSIYHFFNGTFIYLSLAFYFSVAKKWENPIGKKKLLKKSLIPLSIINAILIIILVPIYKMVFIF